MNSEIIEMMKAGDKKADIIEYMLISTQYGEPVRVYCGRFNLLNFEYDSFDFEDFLNDLRESYEVAFRDGDFKDIKCELDADYNGISGINFWRYETPEEVDKRVHKKYRELKKEANYDPKKERAKKQAAEKRKRKKLYDKLKEEFEGE